MHKKNRDYLKYYDRIIQEEEPLTLQSIEEKDRDVSIYDLNSEVEILEESTKRRRKGRLRRKTSFQVVEEALKKCDE